MLRFVPILALAVVALARQVPEASVHENVEYPFSHYKRLYEKALADHEELGLKRAAGEACPNAAACKKEVSKCPGFTLLTKANEGTPCSSLKIGKQTLELKPVIFYPMKGSKCCAARQCVVSDCKAVLKEFQFDGTKKCTKNGKPKGPVDKCQERKPKHVCGCDVKMCLRKECKKLPKCDDKCFKKNIKFDECECIKTTGYCTPKTSGPNQCMKDGSKKCKTCQICSDEAAFPGCDKAVKGAKGKVIAKVKKCKPVICAKPKVCDACTQATKTYKDGCCTKVECAPLKLPLVKVPVKGNCGKCDVKKVKSVNPQRKECKKMITVCEPKKCPKPKKECHKTCEKKVLIKPFGKTCSCESFKCEPIDDPNAIVEKGSSSAWPGLPAEKGFKKNSFWCSRDGNMPKPEIIWAEFNRTVVVGKVSFAGRTDKWAEFDFPTNFEIVGSNDDKKWVKIHEIKDNKVYRTAMGARTFEIPVAARTEYFKKFGIKVKSVKGRGVGRSVKHACIGAIKFTIVNDQTCDSCTKKTSEAHICDKFNKKGVCVKKECKPVKKCDRCDHVTITEDKCKCEVKKCFKAPQPPQKCQPDQCPKEVPAKANCPNKLGMVTVCTSQPCKPDPCPPPKAVICKDQCQEPAAEWVPKGPETLTWCKKNVCATTKKCIQTATEAQKRLECKGCLVPTKTDKKLACGCHEWKCAPYPKPAVCPTCSSCDEPKNVKVTGCPGASTCKCLPKKCPNPSPCEQIKIDASGKTVLDKCKCPQLVAKPCSSVPAQKCTPKKTKLVTVKDKCGCSVTGEKPCDQKQVPPTCKKCETLVTEDDGDCCKKWSCAKKVCTPLNKKLECKKCEQVVVKDDECHCCKATCEPVKCNPVGKCKGTGKTAEEPVLTQDECSCQVKIGCKPPGYGGKVVSCPKPKICEVEVKDLKMCKHCYSPFG